MKAARKTKAKTLDERVTSTAVRSAFIAWGTEEPYFARLTQLIKAARERKGKGAPKIWVRALAGPVWCNSADVWTHQMIAAAIDSHVKEHRLRAAGEAPQFSDVGTRLGEKILGPNSRKAQTVGEQLLVIAQEAGLIELPPAEKGRDGLRVVLTPRTDERLQRLFNADGAGYSKKLVSVDGAMYVLQRVRTTPPTGVVTKQKRTMQIARPPVPPRVVKAADKIQGTAWRVNTRVLDKLMEVELRAALGTEERPAALTEGEDTAIKEACHLAALERFYFPVTTDFRGRINQHGGAVLSYTNGSDYARSLLEFADGEILDSAGRAWLCRHAAGMWGVDLTDMTLGDGTKWWDSEGAKLRWQDAKEPAQFLAATLALEDASDGRPVHLPVRVDATCSVLQHLALLLGDESLAMKVNIWGDSALPRSIRVLVEDANRVDFYQLVADRAGLTRKQRKEAKRVIVPMLYGAGLQTCAENVAEERDGKNLSVQRLREDAKKMRRLRGKIRWIKRAERTRQLSTGEREQIGQIEAKIRPLKEYRKKKLGQITKDAKTIREAAKAEAPGAFELREWFRSVAEAHYKVGLPVCWTTPSGFEVVQDYRLRDNNSELRNKVRVGKHWRKSRRRVNSEILHKKKQVRSLPANLVHSLDAALLAEIVAGSSIGQWGVAHDAFVVPANRMWELQNRDVSRATRALYERDVLADLMAQWRAHGAKCLGGEDRRRFEALLDKCQEALGAILGREARGVLPEEMFNGLLMFS